MIPAVFFFFFLLYNSLYRKYWFLFFLSFSLHPLFSFTPRPNLPFHPQAIGRDSVANDVRLVPILHCPQGVFFLGFLDGVLNIFPFSRLSFIFPPFRLVFLHLGVSPTPPSKTCFCCYFPISQAHNWPSFPHCGFIGPPRFKCFFFPMDPGDILFLYAFS